MIGPDVLNFVALAPALSVLSIMRGKSRSRLYVIDHAGEQPMDLAPVHSVQSEPIVAGERFGFDIELLPQDCRQLRHALAANVTHHEEHCVLHR